MAFRTQRDFKILLFRIEGKRFAVDISEVKKVIKEKGGNMEITEIEGAPPYIIGISEIEIVQNQKDLITFIDFRKIIDIGKIESGDNMTQDTEGEKSPGKEEMEDKNSSSEMEDKRQEVNAENIDVNSPSRPAKRRIFMIISNLEEKEGREAEDNKEEGKEEQQKDQKKPKYIGILIDQVERIEEVRENDNATLYPPPDIKGLKDFFREIVVFNEEEMREGERRILVLNTQKFFEYIS